MGQLRFLVPADLPPGIREGLTQAYVLGGYDLSPLTSHVKLTENELTVESPEFESGYLTVPWPIKGHDTFTITTATLRNREEPYRLLIELARGKLNQVRNQTYEWISIGLAPGTGYLEKLNDLCKRFGMVAVADGDEEQKTGILLADIHSLADRLVRTYTEQVFSTRHQQTPKLDTLLGCRIAEAIPQGIKTDAYLSAFNSTNIVPTWRQIESVQSQFDWTEVDNAVAWAEQNHLATTFGPILNLNSLTLPQWIEDWDGDLPSLAAFCCDFVEIAMSRYQGRIKTWHILDGFNHQNALGLDEDERLRLAARVLDSCRQVEPEGEFIITIGDPWGTYKTQPNSTYSPLVYADTLLRSGLRITALELDLCESPLSVRRDLLDTAKLFETFSVLGLPLRALLGFSVSNFEPLPANPLNDSSAPDTSISMPIATLATIGRLHALLSLCVCLPQFRSVSWRQWSPAMIGGVPGMGLDTLALENTFSITDLFAGIRQAHLE